MSVAASIVAVACGVFALPFGLLPSVLIFRGLANGTDASPRSKLAYALTVWGGMAVAFSFTAVVAYALASSLIG